MRREAMSHPWQSTEIRTDSQTKMQAATPVTPHVPPSAEELEEVQRTMGATDHHLVVRMGREIKRLRGGITDFADSLERQGFAEIAARLRAASEGK
jgi:hypothetical protein